MTNIDYDVVYMAYGAIDYIQSGCTMNATTMSTKIVSAIENTRDTIYPNATYVMAGYCVPSQYLWYCPSEVGSVVNEVMDTLTSNYENTPAVKIMNHISVCGGSESSYVMHSNIAHHSLEYQHSNTTQLL